MLAIRLEPMLDADGGMGGGGGDFSDYGSTPQATPQTPQLDSTPQQPQGQNPLMDAHFGMERLNFAGREVPVVDPVIKDIHKDYSNLHRAFQESSTSLKQLQEQNQMYQQMVQQYQQMQMGGQQQQQQFQQQPQQPQPPSAEEMQAFSTRYMDTFYDNPVEAQKMMLESPFLQEIISKQVENLVRPYVEPIQKERKFNAEVQQLNQQYGDFQQFVPQMQQLLQTQPHLADMGLETVYLIARGQSAQAQPQYTPEQLLNDPTYKQQIVGNEQIRNEIISQYMSNRQQANQQIPPVIGNQPGGGSPAMPENRPKTLKEGSKAFARFLGMN